MSFECTNLYCLVSFHGHSDTIINMMIFKYSFLYNTHFKFLEFQYNLRLLSSVVLASVVVVLTSKLFSMEIISLDLAKAFRDAVISGLKRG